MPTDRGRVCAHHENPAFSPHAPSFGEVVTLLREAGESSGTHRFWPADLPLSILGAARHAYLGHQQITDAYLLALAVKHRGVLVTTDGRMRQLAAPGTPEAGVLQILSV